MTENVEVRARTLDLAGVATPTKQFGHGKIPLVLLHGVLSEGSSWDHVAAQLSEDRWVVVPDLPLHGGSKAPPDFMPDPPGMVAWLEALMDALGVARADLCGLSMGGAVAVHLALARPGRVRRLVLVDAANVAPLQETYRQFIDEMRTKLEAALGVDVRTSSQCWTTEFGFEGEATAAVDLCADPIIMGVLEYMEAQGIPFGQVAHGLDLLEPVPEEDLARIQTPTLAIWGAEDPFFPADEAARSLSALPDGRVEVLQDVGHNPVAERPDEFVGMVRAFLSSDP